MRFQSFYNAYAERLVLKAMGNAANIMPFASDCDNSACIEYHCHAVVPG